MQKITPFLWFNDNLEEAVNFYTSVFKNSKIIKMNRLPPAAPGPKGRVMTATFELEGLEFIGLNGGPAHANFTEAISLLVDCKTQVEVDELWAKLTEGGRESRCGWLKDKFGLSWQIVPSALGELLAGADAERSKRVMEAMMKMVKLDIETLRRAYAGE
jgi:predicted 3-demethylubiquinone-9 3-methyltransferase (glyoxalase superfamily)